MKNKILFYSLLCLGLLGCSKSDPLYLGKQYVGAKYMNDPLGEEIAPDSDPLIRFDAFDCTTFVETALANGDRNLLNKIRYKNGEISFLKRNHFIETDWIQNNSDIVENASGKYSKKTAIRTVTIDKQTWFNLIHNIKTKIPLQTIDMEYIPYSDAINIKTKKTLIVLFIIDNPKIIDKIGSDLAVAHMGFLLPNGMLRHASSQMGRVIDVDFNEYIRDRAKDKTNLGVTLLEIK